MRSCRRSWLRSSSARWGWRCFSHRSPIRSSASSSAPKRKITSTATRTSPPSVSGFEASIAVGGEYPLQASPLLAYAVVQHEALTGADEILAGKTMIRIRQVPDEQMPLTDDNLGDEPIRRLTVKTEDATELGFSNGILVLLQD